MPVVVIIIPFLSQKMKQEYSDCMPFFKSIRQSESDMRNVQMYSGSVCPILQCLLSFEPLKPPFVSLRIDPSLPETPEICSIYEMFLQPENFYQEKFPFAVRRSFYGCLYTENVPENFVDLGDDPEKFTNPAVQWKDKQYKGFALDCEMVSGVDNEELVAKISIVDWTGSAVMNEIIRPDQPIKDYRTSITGVTAQMLERSKVTLKDIHEGMKSLFGADSFLIGHSIVHDLSVLKIAHPRVIDTAILYGHPKPPSKYSLNRLLKNLLNKELERKGVHDPEEDCRACLDLVKLKLNYGIEYGRPPFLSLPPPFLPMLSETKKVAVSIFDTFYHQIRDAQSTFFGDSEVAQEKSDDDVSRRSAEAVRQYTNTQEPSIVVSVLRDLQMASEDIHQVRFGRRTPHARHETSDTLSFSRSPQKENSDNEDKGTCVPYIPSATVKKILQNIDANIKRIATEMVSNSLLLCFSPCGDQARFVAEQRASNDHGSPKPEEKKQKIIIDKGFCMPYIVQKY
eukprot:GHVP01021146.1.p1 GENE.GHVP01021146.1~~GHVP01021146.1.p1  ORF type:complete len:570 (+),score=99.15 GHVP01021146.1:179-1711(+)